MLFTHYPWPLSELPRAEADAIDRLPPKMKDGRINQLKRDIASGVHAQRQRQRKLDQCGDFI